MNSFFSKFYHWFNTPVGVWNFQRTVKFYLLYLVFACLMLCMLMCFCLLKLFCCTAKLQESYKCRRKAIKKKKNVDSTFLAITNWVVFLFKQKWFDFCLCHCFHNHIYLVKPSISRSKIIGLEMISNHLDEILLKDRCIGFYWREFDCLFVKTTFSIRPRVNKQRGN